MPAVCGSARPQPLRSAPLTATTDCFALSVRVTKSGWFRCRNRCFRACVGYGRPTRTRAGCFPRAPPPTRGDVLVPTGCERRPGIDVAERHELVAEEPPHIWCDHE